MPPTRKTPYVSVNLTEPARDALQRSALNHSAQIGKRLPMSAIVVAALALADRHPDEMTALLAGDQTGATQ